MNLADETTYAIIALSVSNNIESFNIIHEAAGGGADDGTDDGADGNADDKSDGDVDINSDPIADGNADERGRTIDDPEEP